MARPVVGVIANSHVIHERYPVQGSGEEYLLALRGISDALPLMLPALPSVADIGDLLQVLDGVVLTGGRPNVHPSRYGAEPSPAYEPYDQNRDAVALALVEGCVATGKPLLGVCRGFQEMNVACGGTLHPEIRELPGRMNHRMPRRPDGSMEPDPDVIFAIRHTVRLTPDGVFAGIFGADCVEVNTLHGQGILEPGARVIIEGRAEDGTPEAIRIDGAPGFALGVQWHAEYKAAENDVNRALFAAFGEALRERRRGAGR